MELNFYKAQKQDAEILIERYNSAFMMITCDMGNALHMDGQKENMEKSIENFPKMIAYLHHTAAGVISFRNKAMGNIILVVWG